MKKLQHSLLITLLTLASSSAAQIGYGQFTEAACPIKISEALSSIGSHHEYIVP
jgi:hypothetical protein